MDSKNVRKSPGAQSTFAKVGNAVRAMGRDGEFVLGYTSDLHAKSDHKWFYTRSLKWPRMSGQETWVVTVVLWLLRIKILEILPSSM